jgi:hypothetical protein
MVELTHRYLYFSGFILKFNGAMLSMVGDVPSTARRFVNLEIYRLSPSEVLIG